MLGSGQPQAPPTKVPVWTRALYSWGGETQGDLGFVEGDLIEYINAGDGNFWFGRNKRNHAAGHFPSNFVQVLEGEAPVDGDADEEKFVMPAQVQATRKFSPALVETSQLKHLRSGRQTHRYRGRKKEDTHEHPLPDRHVEKRSSFMQSIPGAYPASTPRRCRSTETASRNSRAFDYENPETKEVLDATPSPLRSAMDELIASLETLGSPSQPKSTRFSGALIDDDGDHQVTRSTVLRHARSLASHGQPLATLNIDPIPDFVELTSSSEKGIPQRPLNTAENADSQLSRLLCNHTTRPIVSTNGTPESGVHPTEFLVDSYSKPKRFDLLAGYPSPKLQGNCDATGQFVFYPEPAMDNDRRMEELNKDLPQMPPLSPMLIHFPKPPPHRVGVKWNTRYSDKTSPRESDFSAWAGSDCTAPSSVQLSSNQSTRIMSPPPLSEHPGSNFHCPNQPKPTQDGAVLPHIAPPPDTPPIQSTETHRKTKTFFKSAKKLFTPKIKECPANFLETENWQVIKRQINRSLTPPLADHIAKARLLEASGIHVYHAVSLIDHVRFSNPPTVNYLGINFQLVDKSVKQTGRSILNQHTPPSFCRQVICRPFTNNIQKLRAIYAWVSEYCSYDDCADVFKRPSEELLYSAFHTGKCDSREVAEIIRMMCLSINIRCEIVIGYLKRIGEKLSTEYLPKANHAWNAIYIGDQWRMLDASLASQTHPFRPITMKNEIESFYFLTPPIDLLWTHIPLSAMEDQYVKSAPLPLPALLSLPYTFPTFFRDNMRISSDFNLETHATLRDLQMVVFDVLIPEDIECYAEVESHVLIEDPEGDLLVESEDSKTTRGLVQVIWKQSDRIARIKGVLPPNHRHGVLTLYAGRKGLMTSAFDNPHLPALAVPVQHIGVNPSYQFMIRHPTPDIQIYDIYINEPQCLNLHSKNKYLFQMTQHPSRHELPSSHYKPAKLAIQSPGGKIIRCLFSEHDSHLWSATIKINDPGKWYGLVYSERAAKWRVMAEWHAI